MEGLADRASKNVAPFDRDGPSARLRRRAAYRDYFASDSLMFQVSRTDRRLRNKDEVLVMRLSGPGGRATPIAIDVRFLRSHPVYSLAVGQSRASASTDLLNAR